MPPGSQSPHSMRTVRLFTIMPEPSSTRLHAKRAVEPDHLAVEITVLDDVEHEGGELRRLAEQLGKRNRGGEALLRFLGKRREHRRHEDTGRDRIHANAEL